MSDSPTTRWEDELSLLESSKRCGMFLGSIVSGKNDVLDWYQWRGEEYLSLSVKGVNSDQQMTKTQVGQGLHESYHNVFEAF